MTDELKCWSCGASLESLSPPLSRHDLCPACAQPLHVCRQCRFYDPSVAESCTEDDAERVTEKSRANFCEFFSPSPDAWQPDQTDAESNARAELDALFGEGDGAEGSDSDAAAAAEDLFRK